MFRVSGVVVMLLPAYSGALEVKVERVGPRQSFTNIADGPAGLLK